MISRITLAFALALCLTGVAYAEDDSPVDVLRGADRIERDTYRRDMYRLKDSDGATVGTIRKEPFRKDSFELRDDRGRVGTITRDPWRQDRWDVKRR